MGKDLDVTWFSYVQYTLISLELLACFLRKEDKGFDFTRHGESLRIRCLYMKILVSYGSYLVLEMCILVCLKIVQISIFTSTPYIALNVESRPVPKSFIF